MVRIELTEAQAELLRDVLEIDVSDLGMEIADTDRKDFRDRLKARREMLQAVLAKLPIGVA